MHDKRNNSPVKRYAWVFIVLIAIGGLFYPKLGLLMVPIMVALALIGLFKGKYWCGNLCPHGSLFDGIIFNISRNVNIPPLFRSKALSALALAWFIIMLGYRLSAIIAQWGSINFYDQLGYIFVINYLMVTLLGTAVGVFVNPRTWCHFCPMGSFQVIMYRLGKLLKINEATDKPIRLKYPDNCRDCGLCSQICPMQLDPQKQIGNSYDDFDDTCIRCELCIKSCPVDALQNQDFTTDHISHGNETTSRVRRHRRVQ